MVSMYCSGCKKRIKKYNTDNWYHSEYWCDDCLKEEKKKKIKVVASCSLNDLFGPNFTIPEGGLQ